MKVKGEIEGARYAGGKTVSKIGQDYRRLFINHCKDLRTALEESKRETELLANKIFLVIEAIFMPIKCMITCNDGNWAGGVEGNMGSPMNCHNYNNIVSNRYGQELIVQYIIISDNIISALINQNEYVVIGQKQPQSC
jgi:hypothetical protein